LSINDSNHDEDSSYKKMVRLCVAAASFVMLIFLLALYNNMHPKDKDDKSVIKTEETVSDEELIYGESDLTSDDLDFWDMYGDLSGDKIEEAEETETEIDKVPERESISAPEIPQKNEAPDDIVDKPATFEEKIEIDERLMQNTYDFESNLIREDEMLKYYEDNKLLSFFGVDVSKYSGEIDWKKVRAEGVQFAMIRVGVRGYGTGQMILDENFVKNIEGAISNDIKVGVYFFSQAISMTEAVEEANFVVAAISKYKITYPVVCDLEEIENDVARTDTLTTTEVTQYAKEFCDTVKAYGYHPMIYAEKDYLIERLDLSKLSSYDIWLAQESERPNYPYMFTLWQYSKVGVIDGIAGDVDLNLSFVNYEEK